jgi:hypothetical protein
VRAGRGGKAKQKLYNTFARGVDSRLSNAEGGKYETERKEETVEPTYDLAKTDRKIHTGGDKTEV